MLKTLVFAWRKRLEGRRHFSSSKATVFHGYPGLRAAYARLTRALRKKSLTESIYIHFTKTLVSFFFSSCHYWMLFPHAASCTRKIEIVEIALTHIRLTQLTRTHTLNFCLRILTRLKVLLTQPFDMSNPLCKQSTEVLNAAQIGILIMGIWTPIGLMTIPYYMEIIWV